MSSTAPSSHALLLLRGWWLSVCWVSFVLPDATLVAAWISAGRSPTGGRCWGTTANSGGVKATPAALHPGVQPTSWSSHDDLSSSLSSSSSITALFAASSSATNVDNNNIQLVECEDDAASIQEAASFLVDAFWLGSRRQWMPSTDNENDGDNSVALPAVSDQVRSALLHDQNADLWDKFGERLGQRRLEGGIILAKKKEETSSTNNNNEILGLVCLTETLLEQINNDNDDNADSVRVWQASDAEQLLKESVASLSPAQRRQYKNASAQELIAEELLLSSSSSSGTTRSSIVCLSNLAVAPTVRHRGVAQQLCEACEQVARDTWGYSELHLLVEHDNVAARHLYEHKLGYTVAYTLPQETALRVNLDDSSGGFVETQVDTLVLVKKLE